MKFFMVIFLIGWMMVPLMADSDEPLLYFQSIRQKGMGGVGVATTFDDMALLTNPAGLYYANFHLKFPRFGLSVEDDINQKLSKLEKLTDSSLSENDQIPLLQDLAPLQIGFQAALNPFLSLTIKGLGLGVFGGVNAEGSFTRPTDLTLKLKAHSDIVPVIGVAQQYNIFGPTVVGLSAKYISRSVLYDETNATDEISFTQADVLKYLNDMPDSKTLSWVNYIGFGLDFGILRPFSLSQHGEGKWGFVVQNIGATLKGEDLFDSTGNKVGIDSEKTIPVTMSLGASFETSSLDYVSYFGPVLKNSIFSADIMVVSPYDDFKKGIHLGFERRLFFDYLKLRGGINQGYIVGGVGLDIRIWKIPILHLDYANYTEEVGEKVGENPFQNHVIQLGILF